MTIQSVKKDSGYEQKFNLPKLARSIAEALKHCEAGDMKLAQTLAHEAREYLEGQDKEIVGADEIRQAVVHVLKQHKHHRGVQAYEFSSLHLKKIEIPEVVKRSGARELFHPHKLFKSIKKSFVDTGVNDAIKLSEELTKEIISRLEKEYKDKAVRATEIKKLTALLLAERGFKKVERSYLLHKYL